MMMVVVGGFDYLKGWGLWVFVFVFAFVLGLGLGIGGGDCTGTGWNCTCEYVVIAIGIGEVGGGVVEWSGEVLGILQIGKKRLLRLGWFALVMRSSRR